MLKLKSKALWDLVLDKIQSLEIGWRIGRFFESTPPFSWLRKAKFWLAYRTWDKYHVMKATSLKPGYCDKDTLLLHASFDLLVKFVEEECAWMSYCCSDIHKSEKPWYYPAQLWVDKNGQRLGIAHLNWECSLVNELGCQTQAKAAKELKALYFWWKEYLKKDSAYWNLTETFDKETEMLIRLAKVRGKMWT